MRFYYLVYFTLLLFYFLFWGGGMLYLNKIYFIVTVLFYERLRSR